MNSADPTRPVPVAIIGMSCLFPGAEGLARYWSNIRNRLDAITEVPPTHWRVEDYWDGDPKAPDRTYARRGGFLAPVDFPALEFGIAPHNLEATDTTQLLGLLVARRALEDAGYGDGSVKAQALDRDRVSVILGVTGTLELVIPLGARLGHPIWRRALKAAGVADATAEAVVRQIADSYVAWQENSFPGLLGNVAAGRIANRLDLGGTNCVIDAACASSLGALNLALLELAAGRCDVALTGGLDTFNDIFMYMCFSKTPALSPSGDARPFDAGCDGTILGEGLGVLVLKRLDDARRDGDRIYAVIRAVGSSSDGKGNAVYAPSASGQAKALRQAYAQTGVSPATVELVEAHGTGTKVGDATELAALSEVYRAAQAEGSWCALGSIKSQIGHTKAAAGAAGLIKAALALHRKVLPPTAKVTRPLEGAAPGASPFYINTEPRPWMPQSGHPRRAAVSAFGFGGSNFHCVLEEADPEMPGIDWDGDVQIVAFSADRRDALVQVLDAWPDDLSWDGVRVEAARSRARFRGDAAFRLLLVAERTGDDLAVLRDRARALIMGRGQPTEGGPSARHAPQEGIYLGTGPAPGGLAMLFPGQGAQYVGMFRALACQFPMMHEALAGADLLDDGRRLSALIYPHPAFCDADRARQEQALRATEVAQPALGAVSLGVLGILEYFGVRPDAVAGHSFGELTALCASGRIDAPALAILARRRGRLMAGRAGDRGAMLAVLAPLEQVAAIVREARLDVVVANKNAPRQAVLSGTAEAITQAAAVFERRRVATRPLAVSAAFHSRLIAGARGPFLETLRDVEFRASRIPAFSNTTARPYPDDPEAARALLAGQLAEPVEFVAEIEAMYRSGLRTYLEVGPDAKLTGLVDAILDGRDHAALAVDATRGQRGNVCDLARTLAHLAALGHPVHLARWDEGVDSAPSPRKPTLTVKVCGANPTPRARNQDVCPSSPGGPVIGDRAGTHPRFSPPPLVATHGDPAAHPGRNGTSYADPPMNTTNGTASPDRLRHPVHPPSPAPPEPSAPAHHPSDPTLLAQALRQVQENLIALQQLSERTAELHRQFLDGQDKTQRTFQSLVEQQQRMTLAALGRPQAIDSPPPVAGSQRQDEQPPSRHDGATETQAMDPIGIPELPPERPSMWTAPAPQEEDLRTALDPVGPDVRASAPHAAETAESTEFLEEFGSIEQPGPPPPASAPQSPSLERTQAILLEVVAEKTGYPAEMLEPDMQLDADLGIDSIKRVEILSAVQERLPEAPTIKPEHLGTLRTLRQIAAFLGQDAPEAPQPRVAETASRAPALSPGRVQEVLLEVVAERTGYPAEMLEPSMQLDADLGIDSIKRVEILSALQERLPEAPAIKPEHLGTLRTLGAIVEFLVSSPDETREDPIEDKGSTSDVPGLPASLDVQRLVVASVALDRHAARAAVRLGAGGEVWIADDGSDLPEALAHRLRALGHRPRVLRGEAPETLDPATRLVGLILLAPASAIDPDASIREAFRLLRTAAPGLRRSGREGGAALVSVSRLDGSFGLGGLARGAEPAQGGLAGLVKTAGHEWPEVACKAIDLDPAFGPADRAAEAILDEMSRRGPAEVGLRRDGRIALELRPAGLERERRDAAPLGPGDVVVISGGARGITAEVAVALAEALRPTIALLGRSPAPSREPDWLAPLADEAEIKRALVARANGHATPQAIGAQFRSLAVNREILRNLGRIEVAGATAAYRAVDVRDAGAVRACLEAVRAEFGPVRGLIHGAGVLADRRIEDQTDAQFSTVYDTKVAGLRGLLRALEGDELKLLVLFSSSTARFGRVGQVAYASANEVLNKYAQREARRRPSCRVLAVNWGPWDGGMVTPSLKPVFEAEGIPLIAPESGARYLVEELRASGPRPVEVVVLGGRPEAGIQGTCGECSGAGGMPPPSWVYPEPPPSPNHAHEDGGIAPGVPIPGSPDRHAEDLAPTTRAESPAPSARPVFERRVDVASVPVLRSHVIDGRPVLPMALILEWLAQGAMQRHPGLVFAGIDDFRLLKGVVLQDDQPAPVRVLAGKLVREGALYRVAVELRGTLPGGRDIAHAGGVVALADRHPQAPEPARRPVSLQGDGSPRTKAAIYRDVLFHGPDLQGLERVEHCGASGIVARAATAPPPSAWLDRPLRQAWLSDPLAIDCAFQMLSLWCFEQAGSCSLPTYLGRYRQFRRAFLPGPVRIEARVTHATTHRARADIAFLAPDDAPLAQIDDYECVLDHSLNQAFRKNQMAMK